MSDEVRAEWIRQYEAAHRRMLAGGGKAGVARPEDLRGRSGLQVMQALLDGALPYPHILDTLDYGLVEVDKGRAVFQGTPQLKHYNPLGSVHGGWYATLLDSALGCAVHTALDAGKAYTTAELGIHIVRAADERTGPLRAIGQVVHAGRQMATAEARIVGPDGRLYAHGSTTCLVFDAR
ncbi:MAG: PaaI family thioesterase [Rubrivivax sp.]